MIGLLTPGSRGLGWLAVIGRSRVPSPPAITTAFTGATPSRRLRRSWSGLRSPSVHPGSRRPRELPHLDGIEGGRPPVKAGPPERERPADDLGDRGPGPRMRTEEQEGKGVQQAERGRLTHEMHRRWTVAVPAENIERQPHVHLAGDED